MTERELEIFTAVVDCGKMSEAARKLFITQSSVSQAVASIEREYGIVLFERLNHNLYLTEAGRELLSYARNLNTVRKNMDEFLMNASGIRALKVGATVTVGTCVICPILEHVRAKNQDMKLEVSVANTHILEEMLLKNKIDIGLVEGQVSGKDIVSENVIDDVLLLACHKNHRFYGRKTVAAAELEGESMILRENGSGTRALFENQMNELGIPLTVSWNCYNSEAIKNAVVSGYGITVISKRLIEKELSAGELWGCEIDGIELRRHFAMVYHKTKYLTEEIRSFMDECRDFGEKERTLANTN